MKRRKIIIGISVTTVILLVTFFIVKKDFYAKFYNKTGHVIDSLVIGTTYFGHLSIDDSTYYIRFRKFLFDGSEPYEKLSGILQNKHLHQLYWSWCGTDRKFISKGSYIFDIKTGVDDKGILCLYLVKHNGRIFSWQ